VLLAASLAYLVTAAVVPYASPNTVSVAWLVHLAAFAGAPGEPAAHLLVREAPVATRRPAIGR
jgi:hypothetical protein